MADTKISQLTASTTPLDGTELVPVVQSGVTKKVAVSALTAGRSVSSKSQTISGTATGVVLIMTNNVTSGWADVIAGMKAASSSNTYDIFIDLVENNGAATELDIGSFVNIPVYLNANNAKVFGVLANGNVSVVQAGKGLVLKSPDGNITKTITIDNTGNLVVS